MNTVLLDLEGTLLPVDRDGFLDTLNKLLDSRFQAMGFDPKVVRNALICALGRMDENDGFRTNEEIYESVIKKLVGKDAKKVIRELNKFFRKEFAVARFNTMPVAEAAECVRVLKQKGYRLVLASNPIMPEEAIRTMAVWAGLEPDDFSYMTTMENCCYTKKNIRYYTHIAKALACIPEDFLVVGNDVGRDMSAAAVGMDTFLVKDHLVNLEFRDYSDVKQGMLADFLQYVNQELPVLY